MSIKRRKADETDVDIGRAVRMLREYLNMSLSHLSQKAQIEEDQLRMREEGRTYFSASEIYDVANALGLRVGSIFDVAESTPEDLGAYFEYARLHDELGGILNNVHNLQKAKTLVEKVAQENQSR